MKLRNRWLLFTFIALIVIFPCSFLFIAEGIIGTKASPSLIGKDGIIVGIGYNRTNPDQDIDLALNHAFDAVPYARSLLEVHDLFTSGNESVTFRSIDMNGVEVIGIDSNFLQHDHQDAFFDVNTSTVSSLEGNNVLLSASLAINSSMAIGDTFQMIFHLRVLEGTTTVTRNETADLRLVGFLNEGNTTSSSFVFNRAFISGIYDGNGTSPVVLSGNKSPFQFNTQRYIVLNTITSNFITITTIYNFLAALTSISYDSGYDSAYQADLKVFSNPTALGDLLGNSWFWIIVLMTTCNMLILVVYICKQHLKLVTESLRHELFLFKVKGYRFRDVIWYEMKQTIPAVLCGSSVAYFSGLIVAASLGSNIQLAFFLHPTSYIISSITAATVTVGMIVYFLARIWADYKILHSFKALHDIKNKGLERVSWGAVDTVLFVGSMFGAIIYSFSYNASQIWFFSSMLLSISQFLKGFLVIFPFAFIFSCSKLVYVVTRSIVLMRRARKRSVIITPEINLFISQNRSVYGKYFFAFLVLSGMLLGLGIQYSALSSTESQSLIDKSYFESGADIRLQCPLGSYSLLDTALNSHSITHTAACTSMGAENSDWGLPRQIVLMGISENMFAIIDHVKDYLDLSNGRDVDTLNLSSNEVLVSSNLGYGIGDVVDLSLTWDNASYKTYTVIGIFHAIPGYPYYLNCILNYNLVVNNATLPDYVYVKLSAGQDVAMLRSLVQDEGLMDVVTFDSIQQQVYSILYAQSYLPILNIAFFFTTAVFMIGIIFNMVQFMNKRKSEFTHYAVLAFEVSVIKRMITKERYFDVLFSTISGVTLGVISSVIFVSLMNIITIYGTFSSGVSTSITRFTLPGLLYIIIPICIFAAVQIGILALSWYLATRVLKMNKVDREII